MVGLALIQGCAGEQGGPPERERAEYFLDVEDPMRAPAYEFTTVGGEEWAFRDVAEDKLTLLYFGYTSCPDVCPTTMADVRLALEEMGDDADRVDVVMVSTDPKRDTDEQLRSWLDNFDPDFKGVRGPIEEVVEAAEGYGIPVEEPDTVDGEYLVTHGGRLAVLAPGGDAVGFFDEGTSADQMSTLLPDLVQENL